MPNIPKFTEKDLEKLEAEAEIQMYEVFRQKLFRLKIPPLRPNDEKEFLRGEKRCSPVIWDICERGGAEAKRLLFSRTVFVAILDSSKIDNYERVCNNLEPFFVGSREEASYKEKMAYRSFRLNKDLSVEAMKYFADHFARNEYFGFASGVYEQWFSSLRLGLYSNPERVLNGISNLNYPDLRNDPSPRLKALKEYLEVIYRLRVRIQVFDILIRNQEHAGDAHPNISMGRWEGFIADVKKRLTEKFGTKKSQIFFKKMFGSDNPVAPTSQSDFNAIQKEIHEQIAQAVLTEQMGGEWEPEPNDGMHRDYAKEQQERERRERENRERKERERAENDWSNIDPAFRNNPNLVKQWTDRGFSKQQTKEWIDIGLKPQDAEYAAWLRDIKKVDDDWVLNQGDDDQLRKEFKEWKTRPPEPEKPKEKEKKREPSPSRKAAQDEIKGNKEDIPPPKETNFNSSDLNDALNKLRGNLEQDSKDKGHDQPPLPDLSLGPNSITMEDKKNLPWLVVGVELKTEISKNLGSGGMERMPFWKVFDPANFAIASGSGDYVTLLCQLWAIRQGYSGWLHNIFWIKNPDKKGFARLVKDDTLEDEEEKDKLLITGKRGDDLRADKVGWKSWFWDKNGRVSFGIPGVKQKSWRFTRWMRTGDKAYDLDDTNHFIGILKSKGLLGGFRTFNYGRVADWGSAPKISVLWITNQLHTPYSKNKDWSGDDIHTINPNNGYSHYFLFSNLTTEEINKKYITNSTPVLNCKNLSELVGKIVKEGKGVLVRLGPDALELINSQNQEQKERSEKETKTSVENNQKAVSEQDLQDIGISKADFEDLNTPFTDEAKIANLIKQISKSNNPQKVAELLNKLFDHCKPETREAIFNQMVDNNPVFNDDEKRKLKEAWKQAKTTEDKKKVFETLTSHQAQREAFAKKAKPEKDNIFEEQVNQNPRYGPPGEDTQERRDRFKEYEKANDTKKEQMQTEENEQFTTGENANQWGNYFADNANRSAGAGDESVGSTADNNFDGKFSWTQSLESIYKLKELIGAAPEEMKQGMSANQPYWQVIMYHPLTAIFVFMGLLMGILASVTKKR